MIIFNELTIRNFLSFGNNEQTINFTDNNFIAITAFNKDKPNDDGNKNGCGKSSIFNALHYCLYGIAIGNKVKLTELPNKFNKKNMIVSLSFSIGKDAYKIIRGRNPNILKLIKNNEEINTETLGTMKDTQEVINNLIGMSPEVFNQTIMLTKSVPMFFDQTLSNQKYIIEKILGVDVISNKIEILKEKIKETKNDINNEKFKIDTIKVKNNQLLESYNTQKTTIENNIKKWESEKQSKILSLQSNIQKMESIDFEKQNNLLTNYLNYESKLKNYNSYIQQKNNIEQQLFSKKSKKELLEKNISSFPKYNSKEELQNLQYNEDLLKTKLENDSKIKSLETSIKANDKLLNDYSSQIMKNGEKAKKIVGDAKCPTCGSTINEDKIKKILIEITAESDSILDKMSKINDEQQIIKKEYFSLKSIKYDLKPTIFKTLQEYYSKNNLLESYKKEIISINESIEELNKSLSLLEVVEKPNEPEKSIFENINQLIATQSALNSQKNLLDSVLKESEHPYKDSLSSIESLKNSIENIDETKLYDLTTLQNHQDILLKLLNSPTSYIRKTILDKSIDFLNSKIKYYLAKLGSLHLIQFNNDMSINISYMGLTFGYISSGEEMRVAMALTFAFRDVWETLNDKKINILMIDEILDTALDVAGKRDMIKCLSQEQDRHIYVVTHDDSILNSFNKKMVIVRENNFSQITYK